MSGLCLSCAEVIETSAPAATPHSSLIEAGVQSLQPNDRTRTFEERKPNGFTRTAWPEEEIETGDWKGEVRQRVAPEGYDLFRYLGGGGMGDVYLAREQVAERIVAMKFLRGSPHSTAAHRFVTEVRALARLDHPNIVRVISVDLDRADPHFTMEFVPGGTLAERVKKEGPLPPEEAARIVAVLARAVGVAHDANILHRDLKPSNVVLASDGTPKITDFGLAKRTDAEETFTTHTGPMGTPSYMPPEQISSKYGAIGPAADVYGLGATLYHLLTGRPPFQGEREEIFSKVVKEDVVRIRSLRAKVPLQLEAIAVKCLEKVQKNRYSSASALAEDLDRFLAGLKPRAPQLTRVRRAKQWVQRNRASIATGVFAAALAFIIWATIPPRQKETPIALADSEAAAREKLAAGQGVKIIGATGYPDWLRDNWLTSPSGMSASPAAENALAYESVQTSLLAVMRDPGIDRYQMTAELRLMTPTAIPDNAPQSPNTLPSVGLFFGHMEGRGENKSAAHAFLSVRFIDYLPPQALKLDLEGSTQLYTGSLVFIPNRPIDDTGGAMTSPIRFTPSKTLPADWRRIRVQVSPDGIKTYWSSNLKDPWKPLVDLDRKQIAEHFADRQRWLDQYRPELKITLPPWSPRSAFGIWNRSSAMAVRNVVVEPSP